MLKTLCFATIEVPYSCFSDSHGLSQEYKCTLGYLNTILWPVSAITSQYNNNTACCLLPAACVQAGRGRVSKPFQFTKSNCFLFVYAFSPHTTASLLPLCILPIGGTILSIVP